jgi:ATP-dependent DNA helicase RecQ
VPDDLFDAVVKVLASWGWERRPAAIVTVASDHRSRLISSLGERLGQVGRLPVIGCVEAAPPNGTPAGSDNSAQRLATLWQRFRVPPALATSVAELDGPVLLVDDRIDTGWTMTVVAKLLREAGASAVLPLALAAT